MGVVDAVRVERFEELASRVAAGPPRLGPVRFVAVDGPAGSGKTTFSGRLAVAVRATGARVAEVHVDDLLAGWSDLTGYWARLKDWILDPLRLGRPAHYRPYDWHREQFEDGWREIAVPDVLIVEGVGSARRAAEPILTVSAFVTADRALRLARGVTRDGEQLRPQWLRWMRAEDQHYTDDATQTRADLVVDGDPRTLHDAGTEYIRMVRP